MTPRGSSAANIRSSIGTHTDNSNLPIKFPIHSHAAGPTVPPPPSIDAATASPIGRSLNTSLQLDSGHLAQQAAAIGCSTMLTMLTHLPADASSASVGSRWENRNRRCRWKAEQTSVGSSCIARSNAGSAIDRITGGTCGGQAPSPLQTFRCVASGPAGTRFALCGMPYEGKGVKFQKQMVAVSGVNTHSAPDTAQF